MNLFGQATVMVTEKIPHVRMALNAGRDVKVTTATCTAAGTVVHYIVSGSEPRVAGFSAIDELKFDMML